jgi:hypothetical protein
MNPAKCVLLLADRRQSQTAIVVRRTGYRLMTTFTPDHAVALCVNNDIDAVVLDQAHFVVTDNWSVAQSIKLIKPRICVVLIAHGKIVSRELPAGIDAIVGDGDSASLIDTLKKLL